MKHFIPSFLLLTLSSCSGFLVDTKKPLSGDYTLNLEIGSGIINPVRLKIDSESDSIKVVVINDTETILADSVSVHDDSIFFKLPVFNSLFAGKITSDSTFEGTWHNYHKGDSYEIPFKASKNKAETNSWNNTQLGKYEVWFSPNTSDSSKAIGIFDVHGPKITGTFLTETGDYRFLQGEIKSDSSFYMSCFDGSHAFLFTGNLKSDSIVNGMYYSGKHHSEPWIAIKNQEFKLRDPYSLTALKEGYEKVTFTFPDLNNKPVSLEDRQFKGKPVIIQIMGSWCPNCLDESKYFTQLYDKYSKEGLEIIALAYEARPDFEYASTRVSKLKKSLGAKYTFLVAGTSNKEEAAKTLPMLNQIMSFPTTIILDREHNVQSIYTGFNGPSTGKLFDEYKDHTEKLIEKLIQ